MYTGKDEYVDPDRCDHESIVPCNGELVCQVCGLVDPLREGGLERLTPGKAFSFSKGGLMTCRREVISSSRMLKSRRMGDRIRKVVDRLGLPREPLTKVIFKALTLWKPLRKSGRRFYKAELALTYLACEDCGIPMNFRDFVSLTGADPTTTYRGLQRISQTAKRPYRTTFAEDHIAECDLAKIADKWWSGILKLEAMQIARGIGRLGLSLSPRIAAAVAVYLAAERNGVEIVKENTKKRLSESKVFSEAFDVSESVVKERIKQVASRMGKFSPPRISVTPLKRIPPFRGSERRYEHAKSCIRVPGSVEKTLRLKPNERLQHQVVLFEGTPVLRLSRNGWGEGLTLYSEPVKTYLNSQGEKVQYGRLYLCLPREVEKDLLLNPQRAQHLTYTIRRKREDLEWWLWRPPSV